MSWVGIDDGFPEHPKIARVGPIGAWIQLQALCYANRNLTDGFIPFAVAHSFPSHCARRVDNDGRIWTLGEHSGAQGRDVTEQDWINLLVDAGIWEVVPGGYYIHDYPVYQLTKAEVLAKRAGIGERVQRWRNRRNAAGNGVTNAVSNTVGNGPVTLLPIPTPDVFSSPDLLPESIQTPLALSGGGTGEPTRRAHARRATHPWPDDFSLTDERRTVATACNLDAGWEWNKFRDNARMHDKRYANWDAAWRNWCRKAPEFAPGRGHGGAR